MKKIMVVLMFAFLCAASYAEQMVVAVFPFEAKSGTSIDDANTVTDVFNIKLQATGALRTVGRAVIDNVIKQEHIYQMSDFSSDEKTAQLRKGLNADWVVYGVVTKLGRTFVITATLIDLNTNETMGGAPMQMDSIEEAFEKMDAPITEMIQRLTGGNRGQTPAGTGEKIYKIGDAGPAGGIVFYDKGTFSNGWRYLEAAPQGTEFTARWGTNEKDVKDTGLAVGNGKRNTQLIVERLRQLGETAAQTCGSLDFNGYKDWFLPSKDELDLMYKNLKTKNLGGFTGWYWSSSEVYGGAWAQKFSDGSQAIYNKYNAGRGRAVRAF